MSNILAATIEVQQEEIAELREQLAAARLKTDEACKTVQAAFKRNGRLEQQLTAAEALLESFGDLLCEGHLQAGDDHIAYAPTGDWCPFDGITTWMLKQTG